MEEHEPDRSLERRLLDIEGQLALLGDWQSGINDWRHVVNPPITRLLHDQAYRDRRVQERDKTWKRRGVWSAVAISAIGIVSGLSSLIEKVVHAATHL